MKYGTLRGLPRPLPRIVLGTLSLNNANDATFAILDTAVQMGCYAFDTACAYGAGASERVLGRWMAERNNRSTVLIVDKGAHPAGGRSRVDPVHVRHDLRVSLRRLETDYIDLYLLHRDDSVVPVAAIIEVLNELKEAGKILLFGASNWTRKRLQEANEYAEKRGLYPFSVSSNQFSLAVQYDRPYPGTLSIKSRPDDPEWAWYVQTKFPLLCWSSLARGFFSGRFTRENLTKFTDQQSRIAIRCYAREDNFERLRRARVLAEQKGVSVAQIALAYIFCQPLNCFAVTGSLNPAHVRESVRALDVALTDREVAWLDLQGERPD